MYENQDIEKIKELELKVLTLEKQLSIAKDALNDIIGWNNDLDDEWDDIGVRAQEAIKDINIVDGF
jgi:hypothetical protein